MPGMDTHPPDAQVKPGPLSKIEIQRRFKDDPDYERIMALANELESAQGRIHWFEERLAFRDQEVADLRIQLDRAQRAERELRVELFRYESLVR